MSETILGELLQLVQGGLCVRIRPVETMFDMVLDQLTFGVADGGGKEAPDTGRLYGRTFRYRDTAKSRPPLTPSQVRA
jgi:hypothetical protein